MLNVAQITSELARLPDNALQRYAMMHKDDPYVLSLALSESNRRKEMRSGAQMQAAPQPSVADQAVAGMAPAPAPQQAQPMLPEQIGIGALPAQNIQRMAGGGITGYDDGVNSPNPASGPAGMLAYENEPVLRMADGGMVAFAKGDLVEGDPMGTGALETANAALGENTPASSDSGILKALGFLLGYQTPESRRTQYREEQQTQTEALKEKLKTDAASKAAAQARSDFAVLDPRIVTPPAVRPLSDAPLITAQAKPPAPGTMAANAAAAARRPGTAGAAEVQPSGLEALMGKLETLYGKAEQPETEEAYFARKRKAVGENPAIAQLARLEKMDAAAKEEREQAQAMALMQAGLGMMSSRSPYAMVGIGEGGKAGLESYAAAQKELKAAAREREKMRMDVEKAQYAAKEGAWDDYEKYRDRIKASNDKRQEHLGTAYAHFANTQMQVEGQKDIAHIRGGYDTQNARLTHAIAMSSPERMAYMGALEKTKTETNPAGDPLRALQMMTESKREPVSRADALKTWATNQMLIQAQNPNIKTFEDYFAQLSGAGAGGGFRVVGSRPAP